ncbi:hypothetical protein PL75_11210 [Neisseria arctica]|uniref:Polymerase A arginine-rich C-terminal domain-containing protein n=2 Tax=Neisseria arctica TaxID=1470200 RepID=A0A0J0YP26_9NEIS|nr:hypothetical protein PL75_11210 [Neisseria arctica]
MGEVDEALAQWWTAVQHADEVLRNEMAQSSRRSESASWDDGGEVAAKKKRRRKPRKRKPKAEAA